MLIRPQCGKKVLWQEMLRHELLAALGQRPVVIVPVGSVEQHGTHCPQDVDISGPYHLAIAAADAIDDFPVIVAPPVLPLQHGRGRHHHPSAGDLHRHPL